MKKEVVSLVFLILCLAGNAQKKSAIGFSFNLTDFKTPNALAGSTFQNAFQGNKWSNLRDHDAGFSLFYWGGLAPKINYSLRYNGTFGSGFPSAQSNLKSFYNEVEGSLHAFLLKPHVLVNPFLTAGIGAGNYWKKNGVQAYVPLGAGLQFNFLDESYLFLQANYRKSLTTANVPDNLFYSFGVAQSLIEKKEPKQVVLPTEVVAIVSDKDGDGVEDSKDKCPDQAGVASLNGCPDRDGDYVADQDDLCPDVAGKVRYQGCPVPDKDNDGFNDESDKCPDVAGVAKYNGCPIPDTDGDGINDENDKCPDVKGVITNAGCPEIKKEIIEKLNYAVKNIYFNTGSAKLQTVSYKALNEIVNVLKANPELKAKFEGHTDNSGDNELNLKLSEARANAVQEYIISKGIAGDRISASGFGEQNPVADNNTAAGKKANRRVEVKLSNY